ncbi:hypothetical protein D4R71_01275 [bacterium]|nr:MAG: hypothetical protein D4R71_01275 [bacterium]
MKKTFIIFMLSLIFLSFNTQTFAQTKPVAYIADAETQGYDSVDYILVQLNSDLDLPDTWNWKDVVGDFKILDGITKYTDYKCRHHRNTRSILYQHVF